MRNLSSRDRQNNGSVQAYTCFALDAAAEKFVEVFASSCDLDFEGVVREALEAGAAREDLLDGHEKCMGNAER